MFIAVFLLNICGGGVSGEYGIDPFGTGPTSESMSISLATLDQQCEIVSVLILVNNTELLSSINFAVQAADVISAQIIRMGHLMRITCLL